MKKILFVCTGNTCRSPMAEGIFNYEAKKRGLAWEASSCGIAAEEGAPASANARLALLERGINMSAFKSRHMTQKLLSEADKIYCLNMKHYLAIAGIFPQYLNKIGIISESGISDPFGGELSDYIACAGKIAAALEPVYSELK